MSVKTKLARQAVKTTAKHSASRFTHKPYRSLTLLALGAVIGGIVGWLIGRSGRDEGSSESLAGSREPTSVATNNDSAAERAAGAGAAP